MADTDKAAARNDEAALAAAAATVAAETDDDTQQLHKLGARLATVEWAPLLAPCWPATTARPLPQK